MSVPIALPTAVAYGVADFTGGLAARRAPVLAVTAVVQLAGLLALLPVALLVPGSPSGAGLLVGGLAGIAGGAGLLLYLKALAVGPMGVVAPLSAVVGAGLPLLVGVLRRGAAGPGDGARGGGRAGGHRAGHGGHRPSGRHPDRAGCSGWPPGSGSACSSSGWTRRRATPACGRWWPAGWSRWRCSPRWC